MVFSWLGWSKFENLGNRNTDCLTNLRGRVFNHSWTIGVQAAMLENIKIYSQATFKIHMAF